MSLTRRDINATRYQSIFLLPKDNNPNYYTMLFKNTRAFFYGMQREDLVQKLDFIIKHKIEKIMGTSIGNVILTYKNLPTLNSFTRSRNPLYQNTNIYKYAMQEWFEEIEDWIFRNVTALEGEIRFDNTKAQWI